MIYRPQTINFREAIAGDTFAVELNIAPAYEIKETTRIVMAVSVNSDVETEPVLLLESEANEISINGQKITFSKIIPARSGLFKHTIQFTTDGITATLYKGLFEIV